MNTILNKDTFISNYLGGFHVTNVSNWEIGGAMIIIWSVIFHIFLYFEQIITIFMNLDVIQTIKNPLNRSKSLQDFNRVMKLGMLTIILVCVASVVFVLEQVGPKAALLSRNEEDYQTTVGILMILQHRATLDFQINSFFNFYTIFQQTVWLVITIYGTIVCLQAYIAKFDLLYPCSWLRKRLCKPSGMPTEEPENPKIALRKVRAIANREVKNMVFRRQFIYFFVLLITELPNVLFSFFMGYISKVVPANELQKTIETYKPFQTYVQIFFLLRAIIIPLLRLFEPIKLGFLLKKSCCFRNTLQSSTDEKQIPKVPKTTNSDNSLTTKSIKTMLEMPDDDPDIVFLSSSLNNMLVSGILTGINLALLRARDGSGGDIMPPKKVVKIDFKEIEIIDPRLFENLSLRQMKEFVN